MYNAPVITLLEAVQRHGTASLIPGAEQVVAAEQVAVANAIAEVDAVDESLGARLEVSEGWAQFKSAWGTLQSQLASLDNPARIEQHVALGEALLSIITVVGNNSNLILDPDIDSYYLIDTVVIKLPLAMQTAHELSL